MLNADLFRYGVTFNAAGVGLYLGCIPSKAQGIKVKNGVFPTITSSHAIAKGARMQQTLQIFMP